MKLDVAEIYSNCLHIPVLAEVGQQIWTIYVTCTNFYVCAVGESPVIAYATSRGIPVMTSSKA
jgi:hypothetical protein